MSVTHIILGVLLVLTFLVCLPIYASFIMVPVFLVRKTFGIAEREIVEKSIAD